MKEATSLAWMLAVMVILLVAARNANATTVYPQWYKSEASYYTLYGNRTACGVTMSPSAWHVAALKNSNKKCGLKVTICNKRRCVKVRVMDSGKHRNDNRYWDLTPRVRSTLRCGDLCQVKWKYRW